MSSPCPAQLPVQWGEDKFLGEQRGKGLPEGHLSQP